MPTQVELRREICAKLIAALEKGGLPPWRKSWTGMDPGPFANIVTTRPYRNINVALLNLFCQDHGFSSRWFASLRQWNQIGCRVRRGSHGCRILFYRPCVKTQINSATGEEEEKKYYFAATHVVFNAEQVEGNAAEKYLAPSTKTTVEPFVDFGPAEDLVQATEAVIKHEGDRAYYVLPTGGEFPNHTDGDYIVLPPKSAFDPPGAYYSTATHELSHWTCPRIGYYDSSYGMNELVAEIGSSFVDAALGLPNTETLVNRAAYLDHYLKCLRDTPTNLFKASTTGSRVADHLLAYVHQPTQVESVVQAA